MQQVIIRGKTYYSLPLFRTIRLVNLMTLYEIGDFDLIQYESRSIKREISRSKKMYRTENLMLRFVNRPPQILLPLQRTKIWEKISHEIVDIRKDIFESHILKIFDFTAWIESKITKISMQKIIEKNSYSVVIQ